MAVKRIVSGGQTGVDQAALDVAIKMGISHGGWISKGRKTENGPLHHRYKLKEMNTESYARRTEQNVIDSDGTLIISHGRLVGGSEYTRKMAIRHRRPWLHIDLDNTISVQAVVSITDWISKNRIQVLNVAGPRASTDGQIYRKASKILEMTVNSPTIRNNTSCGCFQSQQQDGRQRIP